MSTINKRWQKLLTSRPVDKTAALVTQQPKEEAILQEPRKRKLHKDGRCKADSATLHAIKSILPVGEPGFSQDEIRTLLPHYKSRDIKIAMMDLCKFKRVTRTRYGRYLKASSI